MNLETNLENLGLSKQEAMVYLSCLKLNESSASNIAKTAGLQRTTVYHTLKALAKKGLVSVNFKNRERVYRAQNPNTLANRFEKILADFNHVIPDLNALRQKGVPTFGLRFVETSTELKQFYIDILSRYKNQEYYIIGSSKDWLNIDKEFFLNFMEERGRAHIRTKLLLTEESKGIDPVEPRLLKTIKYISSLYTFRSSINIFPNEILIIGHELTSLAVIIEIPAMTDIFKSIFQILWDLLPDDK